MMNNRRTTTTQPIDQQTILGRRGSILWWRISSIGISGRLHWLSKTVFTLSFKPTNWPETICTVATSAASETKEKKQRFGQFSGLLDWGMGWSIVEWFVSPKCCVFIWNAFDTIRWFTRRSEVMFPSRWSISTWHNSFTKVKEQKEILLIKLRRLKIAETKFIITICSLVSFITVERAVATMSPMHWILSINSGTNTMTNRFDKSIPTPCRMPKPTFSSIGEPRSFVSLLSTCRFLERKNRRPVTLMKWFDICWTPIKFVVGFRSLPIRPFRILFSRFMSLVVGSIVCFTSPNPVRSVTAISCANTAVSIRPIGVLSTISFVPSRKVFGNIYSRATEDRRAVIFSIRVGDVNWTKRISNVDNEKRNEASFRYRLLSQWSSTIDRRGSNPGRSTATDGDVSDDETALGTEKTWRDNSKSPTYLLMTPFLFLVETIGKGKWRHLCSLSHLVSRLGELRLREIFR